MIKRGEKALGAKNVTDKSKNEIIEELNKKDALGELVHSKIRDERATDNHF